MERGFMHTIHLHGRLRRFGPRFALQCVSVADAAKALVAQLPGFGNELETGAYRIIRKRPDRRRDHLGEEELTLCLGAPCILHIVPVPAGAKSGGIGKVVLGAVFMAAATVGAFMSGGTFLAGPGISLFNYGASAFGLSQAFTWGSMAALGGLLALSGVSQMLAPTVKTATASKAEERRSFMLNASLGVTVQGRPVPLVFGRYRVPLTIISAGLNPEAAS